MISLLPLVGHWDRVMVRRDRYARIIFMSSNVRGILFNASLNRLRNLRKYIVVLLQGVLKKI